MEFLIIFKNTISQIGFEIDLIISSNVFEKNNPQNTFFLIYFQQKYFKDGRF